MMVLRYIICYRKSGVTIMVSIIKFMVCLITNSKRGLNMNALLIMVT